MIRFTAMLALALAVSATAQTYNVPSELSLERAVKREFPAWLRPADFYRAMVTERFYPIGWSRDGKFAYVHEPVDEACGCYFANVVIQDMRTDKVAWEYKFNQDDHVNPRTGDMPPEDNLRKLWRKNQRLFSRKLRQYGIKPAASSMLNPLRLNALGHVFDATAYVVKATEPDYDEERVSELRIDLASPGQGVKSLYWIHPGDPDHKGVLDAAVLGVIKSPFEPRLAVVGMEIFRGWEGPPHSGYVRIVGGDLRFGD